MKTLIKRFPKPSLSPQQADGVLRSASRRKSLTSRIDQFLRPQNLRDFEVSNWAQQAAGYLTQFEIKRQFIRGETVHSSTIHFSTRRVLSILLFVKALRCALHSLLGVFFSQATYCLINASLSLRFSSCIFLSSAMSMLGRFIGCIS